MLRSFSVAGYRSFRNKVTLDFGKPHDYNWHNDPSSGDGYITNGIISNALVLGENATGKTNLGYALMDVKDNFVRKSMRFGLGEEEDSSFLNGDSGLEHAEFEYRFLIEGKDVLYAYRKDSHLKVLYERLEIDGDLVFEGDIASRSFDNRGLALVGAQSLNWDFADEEMSVLGYLSNSLPKAESPVVFALRRFIERMGMISVPTRAARSAMIHSALRSIVRSEELVGKFEKFLRNYGVDERLRVINGPDGNPALYFLHDRLVPFARTCSSGTLTLLLLFSRFVMREDESRSSFLYIDEFDAYLHYEVAERLVAYFGGVGSCQTVCSTHNTSLVRNATMRPDCVFEITRTDFADGDGCHRGLFIESLADRTSREIRRVNNVEHLLRNGEFD
jgi:hypothetical protein